jgi:CRISPR-associated endonuclease Csn1
LSSPEEDANLVYRKAFLDLNENEIERIRDRRLRALVDDHLRQEKAAGKDHKAALLSFAERKDIPVLPNGIRHVRLKKAEKAEYLVQVKDSRTHKTYKAYSAGKNVYIEVFKLPDGTWDGEAATFFQANQNGHVLQWRNRYPEARLLMRLFKNDLLRIEHEDATKIVRVVRLEPSQSRVRLAQHNEGGTLEDRHKNPDDPFRWIFGQYDRLKEWNAVQVRVDELGRVWRVQPKN